MKGLCKNDESGWCQLKSYFTPVLIWISGLHARKDTSKHNYHQFCVRPIINIILPFNQHAHTKSKCCGTPVVVHPAHRLIFFVGFQCSSSSRKYSLTSSVLQVTGLVARASPSTSDSSGEIRPVRTCMLGLIHSFPLLWPLSVFCRASKGSW